MDEKKVENAPEKDIIAKENIKEVILAKLDDEDLLAPRFFARMDKIKTRRRLP